MYRLILPLLLAALTILPGCAAIGVVHTATELVNAAIEAKNGDKRAAEQQRLVVADQQAAELAAIANMTTNQFWLSGSIVRPFQRARDGELQVLDPVVAAQPIAGLNVTVGQFNQRYHQFLRQNVRSADDVRKLAVVLAGSISACPDFAGDDAVAVVTATLRQQALAQIEFDADRFLTALQAPVRGSSCAASESAAALLSAIVAGDNTSARLILNAEAILAAVDAFSERARG